jgi:hypothetical protein
MDPANTPSDYRSEPASVSRNPLTNLRGMFSSLSPRLWQQKPGQAFWRVATVFSFVMNILLLALIITFGRELFTLKDQVAQPLLSSVQQAVEDLDDAHIRTEVNVNTEIPVSFDLPLQRTTTITLSEATAVRADSVVIRTANFTLNAPATITLAAGTDLPVTLDLIVPVNTTVPVSLTIPVDVPLAESDLHKPFSELQEIVSPYQQLIANSPNCWSGFLFGSDCQ